MSTVQKSYGRHHEVIDPYNVDVSELIFGLMDTAETPYFFQLLNFHFN